MAHHGRVDLCPMHNYNQATNDVWRSLQDLASRLQKKKAEGRAKDQQAFKQLVDETRAHLQQGNECIDWKRIAGTDVIPVLRSAAGMSSLTFGPKGWVITFSIIGLVTASFAGFFAGIVAGVATATGVAFWLKSYRINSLLPKIKTRLMFFTGHDETADFPYSYECLLVDESALGPDALVFETSFCNITQLGTSKALAVFTEDGRAICFIPIFEPGGIINVLEHQEFNLGSSFLGSHIEKYESHQHDLVCRWTSLAGRLQSSRGQIDIEDKKNEWENIVVAPDTLEHMLRSWVLFSFGDKSAPKGILLKGPPGTGKSLIASVFSETSNSHFIKMSVGDLKGEHIGESGNNVRRIWEEARKNQPAIIFIDECEGVFVRRGSDQGDSFTNELVQTFLTEWDGIGKDSHVLVIGATNRPDLIDDAVISRFTDVIDLQPVSNEHRAPLIQAVARQLGITSVIPASAIDQMGGLSGRDLRNVLQLALRLAAPDEPCQSHFESALSKVRGKTSTKADAEANWSSLVLSEDTKQRLKVTCHMVKDAEVLIEKRIPVTRTLLLYGPPGTGKTQIARTLANEAGVSFIARTTADFKGQYLGHAASRIAQTFETARAQSPCILFIDEIDALTSSRQSGAGDALQNEALVQLLQELDGVAERKGFVLVIAATNCINQIDSAIISRFSQKIEIDLPDASQRSELLRVLLANRPVAENLDVEELASRCVDFSGRDLRELITEAFNSAVERMLSSGKSAGDTILHPEDIERVLIQKIPATIS